MSDPRRSSAISQGRRTEGRSPVSNIFEEVHARLNAGLSRSPDGPWAVWGPEHRDSPHPFARRLRGSGRASSGSLTSPGWSMWHLHVGLVFSRSAFTGPTP